MRTPRLELRLPTEDELVALAHVAERGVHPPDEMPFRVPWTDSLEVGAFVEHHVSQRSDWRPDNWVLEFGVWYAGTPIGFQAFRGEDFAADRTFETGSWLGCEFQGRGIGTEMREAVLALGFRGLGARAAISGGFDFNKPSLRVSEKLGYKLVGDTTYAPRGERQRELVMLLTRAEWEKREHPPVAIDGLEPCLPLFGL